MIPTGYVAGLMSSSLSRRGQYLNYFIFLLAFARK